MAEASVFRLVPLILPEPRERLLVLGDDAGLAAEHLHAWATIEVMSNAACRRRSLAEGSHGFSAVLDLRSRVDREVAPRGELVVARLWRGRAPRAHLANRLTRYALPAVGHPLLWGRPDRLGQALASASPRGRFDQYLLALQPILEPLRALGIGWSLSADPTASVIARILAKSRVGDAEWQQTRTRQLVLIGAEVVVRIPLDPGARRPQGRCTHLPDIAKTLHEAGLASLAALDPRNLKVAGVTVVLERRLPGRSAFRSLARPEELRQIYDSAVAFLDAWYRRGVARVPVSPSVFAEHWEKPLAPLHRLFALDGRESDWHSLLATLRMRALGRSVALVPVHGDFWLNNILVDPRSLALTGVVDWDHGQSVGLPLLDLIHLLTWRTSRWESDLTPERLRRLLGGGRSAVRNRLEEQAARLHLDPAWVGDLICRYWFEQLARRVDETGTMRLAHRALQVAAEWAGEGIDLTRAAGSGSSRITAHEVVMRQ